MHRTHEDRFDRRIGRMRKHLDLRDEQVEQIEEIFADTKRRLEDVLDPWQRERFAALRHRHGPHRHRWKGFRKGPHGPGRDTVEL